MRAGREAGRADIADDLTLPDLGALGHVPRECRLVAIAGGIAVRVADLDELAVAAFPTDLLNDPVARCIDRRAGLGGPIDPGVHTGVLQHWMTARTEVGGHLAVGEWFANQEFLRALAGLVIVIDQAIVPGLVSIELARFASIRQRRE